MSWFILLVVALAGCQRPDPEVTILVTPAPGAIGSGSMANPAFALTPLASPTLGEGGPGPVYVGTPTPDPTRPSSGAGRQAHVVGYGESLAYIAGLYGTTVEVLLADNGLSSPDLLYAGQVLQVPGGGQLAGSSFKLIPDSELVYGPSAQGFDVRTAVGRYDGYLMRHQELVEGTALAGPEIVQLVADRFSVNPRLLLAVLEHRAGWVTRPAPGDVTYPMGNVATGSEGLYRQLSWAANQLNWGYYGRSEGGRTGLTLADGARVAFAPDINDGTAGVQNWLGAHAGATYAGWQNEAGPSGFFATFSRLFGNPFAYTYDPLWPHGLTAPALALPWLPGETWYFTGGPHGGWASGSAWAALDFVAGDDGQLGCYESNAWVTAMAGGVVTRSSFGAVVVDLDGDGYAGTGWAIIYMHLATRERVAAGTRVEAGDRLGHPSCEGGFSNGTHVHIARTYNGRWVAADGQLPFVMDGWVSQGQGREYDGLLVRDGIVKVACECREEGNALRRD